MGDIKLMTPLFYDGFFNREGRRMRAVFEREITNGVAAFRLWRCAGKPDLDYPQAENDKYYLHVEANGYLIPLGLTDFSLAKACGFEKAVENLYGSAEEREQHFAGLRSATDDSGYLEALNLERSEIERCGSDPACQTDYIFGELENHVSVYWESKENGGKTFPDFSGAVLLDDLDHCVELSKVFKAIREKKRIEQARQAALEEKAFCEAQNGEAEQMISRAIQVIRSGGVLENEPIKFYKSKYSFSSYSIVNYLMRQYGVTVPLRTQGWVNDRLCSVAIKDGKCESLRYLRAKKERGSQKFFECMHALIQAVHESAEGAKNT